MQISFDGLYANDFPKLLCKTCTISFPDVIGFQKAKNYQNLTAESGLKQRFSLLKEKVVCLRNQAVRIKAWF